jgi:hypothetical protein
VTINVTGNNVNVLSIQNSLNNNWVAIPIANGNSLEIETAVKKVLNDNNIFSCLIVVTIANEGSHSGSCNH